ncbi:MAG: carboxypeptidase-like regulatory domain-containing protein, partial [Acidobacteria bacterium]|nr:carboxypeptidase-like regulatory domain-containing protein [Acidobacteriota bacterium]
MTFQYFFFRAVAFLIVGAAAFGQSSTATLSGVITDEQDRAVGNARLTLLDPKKGVSKQITSDTNGSYVFAQLPASTYELLVEKAGFAKARFAELTMNANDQRSLQVKLKVASQDETVTVTGVAPLVSESPAVATVVDQRFIENQPLNGRSFQTLINLSPGVVLAPSGLVD